MAKQSSKALRAAEFKAQAQRLGGATSANQHRFMSAAASKGKQMEPVGPMTGSLA